MRDAAPQIKTATGRMSMLEIYHRCVTQILIFSQTLTRTKNISLPRRDPLLVFHLLCFVIVTPLFWLPSPRVLTLLSLVLRLISPFASLHSSRIFSLLLCIICPLTHFFPSVLSCSNLLWHSQSVAFQILSLSLVTTLFKILLKCFFHLKKKLQKAVSDALYAPALLIPAPSFLSLSPRLCHSPGRDVLFISLILFTNEFWALCCHRWCSRQPLVAGPWLNKLERERKPGAATNRLPTPLQKKLK